MQVGDIVRLRSDKNCLMTVAAVTEKIVRVVWLVDGVANDMTLPEACLVLAQDNN